MPKFRPRVAAKQRIRVKDLDLMEVMEFLCGGTWGYGRDSSGNRVSAFDSEEEQLRKWQAVRSEFLESGWCKDRDKPVWAEEELTPKLKNHAKA